ncbi:MAG: bifunctional hydroxymethylpyrimidine kinase/phosphomethylpyrimidine kinase [Magnetococcales bacterium]|nr:bifunctional hydroxymethylpyrimidine kinase/phosphomethylpyrimidine kinase [Magnetococcales bacterium]
MGQQRPPTVLVVAGSDPGAGAGLQADLKTITALGGYALTAVTAITVQDTRRVYQVYPLSPQQVVQQMRVSLADVPIDCIKLGMLATRAIVEAVAELLAEWPAIPVVADPVLAGTAGGTLLDAGGRQAFLAALLPRIALLTPNLPEAQALTGSSVQSVGDMLRAARQLAGVQGRAVLVTGGHLVGASLTDLLWDGRAVRHYYSQRLPGTFHGTGCTLAAAIAVGVAQGKSHDEAVRVALRHLRRAMAESLPLGRGQQILNPFFHRFS